MTQTTTALEKIQLAEADINRRILGQTEAVRASMLAWLTRDHVAFIGTHGTAKTLLSSVVAEYFDASSGYRLLSRYSTPDELFGPISIKGLKQDKYKRCMDDTLAQKQAATVDECFKANSALLNSLLGWMNERQVDGVSVPLEVLTGISNEYPKGLADGLARQGDDESILPLWDRFLLRVEVQSVFADRDVWMRVIAGSFQKDRQSDSVSATELGELRERVNTVVDSITAEDQDGSILSMLRKLGETLLGEGVSISERRWRKAVRVLAAAAVLDDRDEITELDFQYLQMVLWESPHQRAILAKALRTVENPMLLAVRGSVAHAVDQLRNASATNEAVTVARALQQANRVAADVKGMIAAAPERLKLVLNHELHKLVDTGKAVRALKDELEADQEF